MLHSDPLGLVFILKRQSTSKTLFKWGTYWNSRFILYLHEYGEKKKAILPNNTYLE